MSTNESPHRAVYLENKRLSQVSGWLLAFAAPELPPPKDLASQDTWVHRGPMPAGRVEDLWNTAWHTLRHDRKTTRGHAAQFAIDSG